MLRTSLALLLVLLLPALAAAQDDGTGWITAETAHFRIHSNASPERTAEIAQSLELFRAVFARLAPGLELRSPAPTRIFAFRDAAAYAPFKSRPDSSSGRILGQFMSHPDGNYLTIDADTEHLVGSFDVIYHEYVHYFVRHNFPKVPLWFNEGLAEYYSTFVVENGAGGDDEVVVGRAVERHLKYLAREPSFDLGDVLATTRDSPSYREGEKAGRFYAVSWALVHYLLSGGDERVDAMADFFVRLADGEDALDAFEEAFGVRVDRMAEALGAYVAAQATAGDFPEARLPVRELGTGEPRVRGAAPADVLAGLGDLLAHMGRSDAARRAFRRAFDHEPRHPRALAGMGLVLDLEQRFEEARFYYEDAVEVGSEDPTVYLYYGRHLIRRAELAEEREQRLAAAEMARAVLATATDLDRSFAEPWALYGAAHLLGGAEPEPGIHALEQAHALLPDRHDVVLWLIRLHLQAQQFDRAAQRVENGLAARGAPPEMVEKARDDVERSRLLSAAHKAFAAGEIDDAVRFYDEAIARTSDPAKREVMEERLRRIQALQR